MSGLVIGIVIAAVIILLRSRSDKRHDERANNAFAERGGPTFDGYLFAFTVAPAAPLRDAIRSVRTLLGDPPDTAPVTRWSRPLVVVDRHVVTLTDEDRGTLLIIPAVNIAKVTVDTVRATPLLAFPRRFTGVILTVRKGDEELALPLVPIKGYYDGVPWEEGAEIARAIRAHVGL